MNGFPGSGGTPNQDDFQRLLEELGRRDEEVRKHRAAAWMMQDWWESLLKSLAPLSPPPPGATDFALPSSTRPRFPLDLSRLDQFPDPRPIFIIGAARSGTTAMCGALHTGAKFFGWSEGHLFSAILPLLTTVKRVWDNAQETAMGAAPSGTALRHLDAYVFLNEIVKACDLLYASRMQQSGASRWVDKTPDVAMLLAAPMLQHVYPQSRMIIMHRHPIHFVRSFLRRFPVMPLEQACAVWTIYGRTWQEVKGQLDPVRCLEVSQASLSLRTDQTVTQLRHFLDLTPEQAAGVGLYLRTERPGRTGKPEDGLELYLEDMNWADELKARCLQDWGELASGWGYQVTKSSAAGWFLEDLHRNSPSEPVDPGPDCLVPLHPRGSGPLLLVVLSNLSDQLFAGGLVSHLGGGNPVYGLRLPRRAGVSQAFDSIAELGAYFAVELLRMFPRGPWHLVGYSSSGRVALETALALQRRGQTVAYLGIVEGLPQNHQSRTAALARGIVRSPLIVAGLTYHLLDRVRRAGLRRVLGGVRRRINKGTRWLLQIFRSRKQSPGLVKKNGRSGNAKVVDYHAAALACYEAPPYPGCITVFRGNAQFPDTLPRDYGWRRLAKGGVTIHLIEGASRETIIQDPYVGLVARMLKADLNRDEVKQAH